MSQAHIFYSGMVQGVGFRYTVHRLATDLGLLGWVKNLPDGRVEIWAEGQTELIEQLVKKIDGHFDGYVRGRDINYQESGSQFTDFRVIV